MEAAATPQYLTLKTVSETFFVLSLNSSGFKKINAVNSSASKLSLRHRKI
jgi:hypothetical protein